MTPHGGRRQGAGGPSKPPLTSNELARACNRAAELNGGRVSSRGLVDAINEERTRGYVDPRTIRRLKVSTWWLREQRKMLRQSTLDRNEDLNAPHGTRYPEYPVHKPVEIPERPSDTANPPSPKQVESEQPGATQ